ncbi:expressed unknown protein [Seminavis robusta]|uniref:Uncharacterized protein n=1 Tax=Seminavis robusta TaxID=568900 RepID=A0A9N8EY03_9STRA|nr:expressed unknown protein [Seminavis robusta]|eukprot:Sro2464_g328510.1 n/a (128) ;mRNA; f:9177-9560
MFAICVYRRFGLAVPIVLFVVALLMELTIDHSWGKGYYESHFWSIGLSVLISGIIVAAVAYHVDDDNKFNQEGYSLLDGDLELGNFGLFLTEPQESDMFCFVPLNWCALALIGMGVILMLLQLIPAS